MNVVRNIVTMPCIGIMFFLAAILKNVLQISNLNAYLMLIKVVSNVYWDLHKVIQNVIV